MSSHPVIQILPDPIINKIAAGEVVDRPASVVKELMENAIDAGARNIHVSVIDGGLKLISIADDGHGMDRDNALLSIERHATSKIRHVDDIENVATLGFRGEALAAIASVSRFTLTTRRAEDLSGTEIRINGGRIEDVGEAGCPPGTRFDIRQLFFNVPARRKFLKAAATELNHIRQVFLLYALGRPDIGLRLTSDERDLYRLDADSQIEDRIRQLYGPDLVRDLCAVSWTNGPWRIHGLASHPRLHRADKAEQYIYVNGRPASAPVLGYAISESYADRIPRGRHPILFLFIEVPPGDVDVNVHPTKKEVRFRRAGPLRDALMAALTAALAARITEPAAVAGTPTRDRATPDGSARPGAEPFMRVPDLPVLPAFDYPVPERTMVPLSPSGSAPSASPSGAFAASATAAQPNHRAPWHWCRILGQIADFFVVLETDEGMILMDPQAAHERVLFERFMRSLKGRTLDTQGLLTPETVTLPPLKAALVRKHLAVLQEIGVGVSEFGGDTFLVEALPSVLGELSAAALLADVTEELELVGKQASGLAAIRDTVVQMAVRAAVRSTTQLSREELERLISDLAMTAMPYTSPRGRPTLVFTSIQELNRKFGRA